MQQVTAAVVVVEVQGVFSFPSIVKYTGGWGALGGVAPVGAPGHVALGARGSWWTLVGGGVEILLAIKNCDGVRGEQ